MNDFAIRKGYRYGTVFVDLTSSKAKAIEVIPGRSEEDVANFLKSHKNLHKLSEVTQDCWKAFIFAVRKYCPRAKIIVDRFRVIELAGKALNNCRKLLSYWMYQVKRSGIPEFLKLAKTIKKWRKEILNYFRAFLTSGPVEAIINKIKLIKRITYGLPNFEHLRARILIECGRPP